MQHYEDVRELARNPWTRVTLVKGLEDESVYVLKRTHCLSNGSKAMRLRMAYAVQEARILSLLKHVNIVQGVDFFTDGDSFCSVQEHCNLGDLQNLLDAAASINKPLQETSIRILSSQIAEAVDYLHKNHILHRDLKPANIFLATRCTDLVVKVGDFGAARKLHPGMDEIEPTGKVGTQQYMAPEIDKSITYSRKADIWSMGVIVIEMLLLRDLSVNLLLSHQGEIRDEMTASHPGMDDIVLPMIDLDPAQRPEAETIFQTFAAAHQRDNSLHHSNATAEPHKSSSAQTPLDDIAGILGSGTGNRSRTNYSHVCGPAQRKSTSWLASAASNLLFWRKG